jgi:hypothetical protein
MVKIIKIKKILSNKGCIFKVLDKKKLYPINEIYITAIKSKYPKRWRKHLNSDTVLLCIKGKIIVETEKIKKCITSDFNNLIIIKKNTKFRLISLKKNSFVMSFLKIVHKKLKTISYE